jgi:hypothetical protein
VTGQSEPVMPGFRSQTSSIEVRTENTAVVVTIPPGAELDESEAKAVNEQFMSRVRDDGVTGALTVLRTENPLSGEVFEQVAEAAAAGAEHGVSRWAVVVDERVKGMAFSSQLEGLETELFEDKQPALNWLHEA